MKFDETFTRREFGSSIAKTGIAAALTGLQPETVFAGVRQDGPIDIAMLVYPRMTALDMVGPMQILGAMGNAKLHFVWKKRDVVVSDVGLPIQPTKTFDECPSNLTLLFAPGGSLGTIEVMNDDAVLDFLAEKGKSAKFVTSVCTGALILGAAGLLKGYKATTHWLAHEQLSLYGAEPVKARVVEDRNRITGGGVTAGIDFGLRLAARMQGVPQAKAIQLMMEYDPQPPFQSGSPEGAGKEASDNMRRNAAPLIAMIRANAERTRKRRT
jgi:cyclohexyl-isocyanide hydratase